MSPSVKIIQLLEKPGAVVTYHDPHIPSITLTSPGGTCLELLLDNDHPTGRQQRRWRLPHARQRLRLREF